jgi:ribonucleoside-diphosphate reductase alpha chain
MSKIVIHRDGKQEPFQTEKIIRAIQDIIDPMKLDDPFVPMFKIIKNLEVKLPDQVGTDEIDRLLLKAMEGLISEDPLYDRIASAQLAKIVNKTVETRFNTFKEYIEYAVSEKLLREEMLNFNLDELEWHMDRSRDRLMNFFAMANFEKKYQLTDYKKQKLEKVQWTWMRMAMGIAFVEPEAEKNEFAKKLYDNFSQLRYIHSHSFNSGSPRSQMSSCFISVVEDSMEHIMEKATEFAQLSKFDGGMGISFTKLRASGSLIKKINQFSSGPIPFIKIYDTIKNAMLQWTGKKRSGCVFYMEPRHYNIYEFLDLKETAGNDYVRTRTCNTALWIPDEFMNRVLKDADRWLFDPAETPELAESWGEEFEKYYAGYVKQAEAGELKLCKKLSARQLYRDMLIRLAKTGNYRFCFKDTHNRVNQAPNYGMIHSSNLCTEISIANRGDSTAVCTLASLNLTAFVNQEKIRKTDMGALTIEEKMELINRDDLKDTVQTAIQGLDNVIEFNFFPYPDTEKNCKDLRPLGLGVMGFADFLIDLHVAYDHHDATTLIDKVGAFMYQAALEKSIALAKQKGPFRDYDPKRYPYEARRNILMLAIAPTASISLLAGVSSGIDSNFGMVYSRENQFGKFTVVCERLINELKAKWVWTEEMKNKIVASGGSIMDIEELDGVVNKDLFKTAYEYSPTSQMNIAAAWQKHIDQAISRNMYFDESYRETLSDYYMYGRQQGVKSTYYCFIQKTIQGEKYTQNVNKRGERAGFGSTGATQENPAPRTGGFGAAVAKAGFGGAAVTAAKEKIDFANVTDEQKADIEAKMRAEKGDEYVEKLKSGNMYNGACPADPYEALMCEACQ